LRRNLGPMAKVQITSGEVTLLEPEKLGRIVEYAREIGLDPMVMTNGQRFSDRPEYLPTLVTDYGLRKVSIHVDSTQHGRRGFPAGEGEAVLRPLRDHFAGMIRQTRRETGARLHAAHTVTVTPDNIGEVPEIMDWALENHDAFRVVSFQPVAEVGRTRDRKATEISLDSVWSKICDSLGRSFNRNALHFGHPSCNVVCPLFVVSVGERREIVECAPEGDDRGAALVGRLGAALVGLPPLGANLGRGVVRLTGLLARNPGLIASGLRYGLIRAWRELRLLGSIAGGLARLRPVRIRPWILVVHSFMNREELATPLGQERLAACVFRVPVDGRMVSMCELNATGLRLELNQEAGKQEPFEGTRSSPPLPRPHDPGPSPAPCVPR